MPAKQKIDFPENLGIIAGGGELPFILVHSCKIESIKPYIVGFKGQTEDDLVLGEEHLWTSLGRAGQIMAYFKKNNVRDIVMIGSIKRPSLSSLKPDFKGMQILSRISLKTLGDDSLLKVLKKELESEGFRLRGIQEFCASLLMPEGCLGDFRPDECDNETIQLGINEAQSLGLRDIGQSVIVQQGKLIGSEDHEGTDALIKRCGPLLNIEGRGGILVKTCKPQQDKFLDLPTIGINTIQNAYQNGVCGIILQAHNVLLSNSKEVEEYANKYKMFVCGHVIQ